MKKLNRLLRFATALAVLFAFGCSNASDSSDDTGPVSNKAVISVSVDNGKSRTALPVNPLNADFTKFVLTGSKGSGTAQILSPEGGWVATESKSAYEVMTVEHIELDVGEWTFTLRALIEGSDEACTVYKGTVTKTLSAGNNSNLVFPLSLESVGTSGSGNIAITLSIGSAVTNVASVEAFLVKSDGSAVDAQLTRPETGVSGVYGYSGIPVGNYIVTFTLKNSAGNVLGLCPEYVVISAGSRSVSSINIENLDADYSITYRDASDNNSEMTLTPAVYTRHGGVTLPVPEKEGWTFCGWYGSSESASVDNESASPVTGFGAGEIGTKTYYAKFIENKEIAPITAVTIDGNVKVGETLTAKAWTSYDAETSDNNTAFAGTVYSYQWICSEDEAGTVNATVEKEVVRGETETGTLDSAYLVKPEDAEKYLSVKIRQKYMATDSESDGIFTISITKATSAETVNPAVSTSNGTAVVRGTLDASSLVLTPAENETGTSLVYNEGTAVVRETTALDDSALNIKHGTVSNVVSTGSTSVTVPVSLSLSNGSTTTAPSYSNYVGVWISAEGYEPVQFVRASGASAAGAGEVFINVKYPTPVSGGTGVPALATAKDMIPNGHVCFTNQSSNTSYQYIVNTSSPAADSANWARVPYSQITSSYPEGQYYADKKIEVPTANALYLRHAAETSYSGAEVSAGEIGYIAASDAVPVTISSDNVGTLVVLSTLTASFSNLTSPVSDIASEATANPVKYGYSLTMTATKGDTSLNDNDLSDVVTYQWYTAAKGTDFDWSISNAEWMPVESATAKTYTVRVDDIGKYLKVVATQEVGGAHYTKDWISGGVVQKGTLVAVSGRHLLYVHPTDANKYATLGAALEPAYIDVTEKDPQDTAGLSVAALISSTAGLSDTATTTTVKNADTGANVEVTFAFSGTAVYKASAEAEPVTVSADTVVPNGSGYVTVLATVPGYESLPMDVAIDVRGRTPTAEDLPNWLSSSISSITYGYIRVNAEADAAGVYYYNAASNDDNKWTRWPIGEFNYKTALTSDNKLILRIGEHATTVSRPSLAGKERPVIDKIVYQSTGDYPIAVNETTFINTYVGTRSIHVEAVSFSNKEIGIEVSENTVTVKPSSPDSAESSWYDAITDWYVDGNLIASTGADTYKVNGETIATLNRGDKMLTFLSGAAPANTTENTTRYYRVTVEGRRNNLPLTTTVTVAVTATATATVNP
ncbi:hypothetical protein [uncultured Treponema sp.]|uniref:hypothetical protein n=1 Tax=uncultured Treponema sp. TaxID=162155 RepID=UPI0025D3442D|nr:hypothetical protein [uncultured Treponema sp.]